MPIRRLASRLLLAGLVASVASAATGCAVMGRQQKENPVDGTRVLELEEGMDKAEVTRLLGAPTEIIFSNREHDPLREHAYVYEYVVTKYTGISFLILNFGNVDQKKDRVVVFLDDEGKVLSVGASLFSHDSSYGFPFGK